jgi:transposase InsO family protein
MGWALEHTLEAALALQALRMALARRWPSPGLVHHSDRGVQYAILQMIRPSSQPSGYFQQKGGA